MDAPVTTVDPAVLQAASQVCHAWNPALYSVTDKMQANDYELAMSMATEMSSQLDQQDPSCPPLDGSFSSHGAASFPSGDWFMGLQHADPGVAVDNSEGFSGAEVTAQDESADGPVVGDDLCGDGAAPDEWSDWAELPRTLAPSVAPQEPKPTGLALPQGRPAWPSVPAVANPAPPSFWGLALPPARPAGHLAATAAPERSPSPSAADVPLRPSLPTTPAAQRPAPLSKKARGKQAVRRPAAPRPDADPAAGRRPSHISLKNEMPPPIPASEDDAAVVEGWIKQRCGGQRPWWYCDSTARNAQNMCLDLWKRARQLKDIPNAEETAPELSIECSRKVRGEEQSPLEKFWHDVVRAVNKNRSQVKVRQNKRLQREGLARDQSNPPAAQGPGLQHQSLLPEPLGQLVPPPSPPPAQQNPWPGYGPYTPPSDQGYVPAPPPSPPHQYGAPPPSQTPPAQHNSYTPHPRDDGMSQDDFDLLFNFDQ
nr:extensin-like [Quercus suber]